MAGKTYSFFWARGNWNDRASLVFVSTETEIEGKKADAYGRVSGAVNYGSALRPPLAHVEDTGNNVIFKQYANSDVVFKITEA